MTLRQEAEGAPYHLATKMEECGLSRFWVVQLDAGFEVYQIAEDASLREPNAWMRLKQFCEDRDVKIANMAFASANLDPATQINLDPSADGYFYSRRVRQMMAADPMYGGYQDVAQGVGELHGDRLKIIWELDDGRVETEERNLSDHPKSQNVSLIQK